MYFYSNFVACGTRNFQIGYNETIYLAPNTTFNADVGFDSYQNDVTCVYFITTFETSHIYLQITHFDLETGYDFLLIGYGDNPSDANSILAKLTGQPKLRTLTSSDSQLWIIFITDSSGVRSGYTIEFELLDEQFIAGKVVN